ncbi:hypothetical protein D3C87_1005500 [compost metagenome]
MVNVKMVPWLAVASALVVMANGCGGSANLVPVGGTNNQAKNITPSSAPIVVQPSPYVPNQNLPNTGTANQLQVTKTVKNGSFLGIGKITVTVQVKNPTAYALSGEVKVTFTDGGKVTEKVQSKPVTVQAMGTETLTFEDPSSALDDANVEVITPNAGYDPHGAGQGYGY